MTTLFAAVVPVIVLASISVLMSVATLSMARVMPTALVLSGENVRMLVLMLLTAVPVSALAK